MGACGRRRERVSPATRLRTQSVAKAAEILGIVEGQCDGNTIADCTISGNESYGVYLYAYLGQCSGNTIRENTVSRNTYTGVYLQAVTRNRIEDNNVWFTQGQGGVDGVGIRTASTTGNFILKNTSLGNVPNYDLDSDDTAGPIVSASGFLSGTDPWANFSRQP
jgi:parallel beta-helix repeat protein